METGQYDDEYCHLISFSKFRWLPGNLSAIVYLLRVVGGGGGVGGGWGRGRTNGFCSELLLVKISNHVTLFLHTYDTVTTLRTNKMKVFAWLKITIYTFKKRLRIEGSAAKKNNAFTVKFRKDKGYNILGTFCIYMSPYFPVIKTYL
jgi:hypothetical protein